MCQCAVAFSPVLIQKPPKWSLCCGPTSPFCLKLGVYRGLQEHWNSVTSHQFPCSPLSTFKNLHSTVPFQPHLSPDPSPTPHIQQCERWYLGFSKNMWPLGPSLPSGHFLPSCYVNLWNKLPLFLRPTFLSLFLKLFSVPTITSLTSHSASTSFMLLLYVTSIIILFCVTVICTMLNPFNQPWDLPQNLDCNLLVRDQRSIDTCSVDSNFNANSGTWRLTQ